MDNILAQLSQKVTDVGLSLLYAALVLIVGIKLSKWASKAIFKLKCFENADVSLLHFLRSAVRIILYAFVVISAAIIIGIPATTFITILGSAAIAVGLALQGSLTNLAGSIMILFFKPFKIGDYIECGAVTGTVEDINLFYTVLRSPDNKVITCPNGTLSNGNIINYSGKDTRRVDLKLSAGYSDNIDEVRDVILACTEADPRILEEPAAKVDVTSLDASSVTFTVRAWCKTEDYWGVYYSLTENAKKAFDKMGIEIPYQQIDIHLKK